MNQAEKAHTFQALHERPGTFVIPNPWDAGTARVFAALGFEALATTSAGYAHSLGRRDAEGGLSREDTFRNASAIIDATDIPVSADLENGFGHDPEDVAETIRGAAGVGLVGGSAEDASGDPRQPIYPFDQAVERIAAAAEAAWSFPFMLVARAENFSYGQPDLEDTIRRLQAFERAGADVLYAPELPNLEAVRAVCSSVRKPVNVVVGLSGEVYSVSELADAGVRRISIGSSFARVALGATVRAALEVRDHGTFSFLDDALPFAEANSYMIPAQPTQGEIDH